MKKIVAFFLALSMAVVMLAGCGASQTPTTTEAPKAETKAATEAAPAAETEQKELTIAGIVFKDEFTMKMVQQGYEDAAKDYGVNLVLGNSMGDLANEQQLVYSYIDMGVDGIAITPYSEEASIPILKEAYDKGIEVAVANIKLNDASFVCGGFLEKLTANGVNYEIVAQQSSTSKNDNVPIVEAMLAGAPDCNVFFCTSAAFTNVVVQVIMNMGLSDKITVVGYDMGEQTATQLLDENSPLYCTLEQDMYTMGYKAVEQLVKTLRGEETECPRGDTVYLEGIIHSKEDLAGVQTWLDGYYKLANS